MKLFGRTPKYFSEAITCVTILSCFLGLRAFEYPRGHPRPVLSLIYCLFIFVIYCNGYLRVDENYYANVRLMKLEYILYELLAYAIILSVMLKMVLGWWYTKKFKVCHKKIFKIDETLRQLGLTVNYDRIYFVTIGTIIIWITIAFVLCTIVFVHLQIRTDICTSIYFIIVYTYSFTVNSINIFEFYIFTRCLQIKFGLVNQLLRESLTNLSMKEMKLGFFELKDYTKIMDAEQRKYVLSMKMISRWRQRVQSRINVSISKDKDPVISQIEKQFQSVLRNRRNLRYTPTMTKCQKRKHLLQVIKQVHLELCRTSKIICTIFGVQTASEIVIIIMYLTGAFYNLCTRYIIDQHKFKPLTAQTSVVTILCCFQIMKAVFLNCVCKKAAEEGNKTIEIIYSIYSCDADTNMQEEIQQFGIQILQSPVTFFAFGLTLNNRVLSMILKIVTTTLVIMLQVSNTLESNNAIQYRRIIG